MLILRSLMFVPGNQERRIERARTVPADALILDLEDSVPLAEKAAGRAMVAAAIGRLASGSQEIIVRVNSFYTPFTTHDVEAVVQEGLRGIILPKSESAEDMQRVAALLAAAERRAGLAEGSVGIFASVETSKGIVNASQVATASPRVFGLVFGAEDYALEMGVRRTKEGLEILYPRMVLAVASHAAGVLALDGVYVDYRDTAGLVEETKMVKQLGFQGRTLIHPDQVGPVNEVFAPSEEKIAEARRIVAAFDEAVAEGRASTSLDGKMVDVPVAERARNLLALTDRLAQKGSQS